MLYRCGRWRILTFFCVFLFVDGYLEMAAPSRVIVLGPENDIQTSVNNNPQDTTFYLKSGVYRLQSITAKSGNIFIGETGAVLNGAKVLSSFTRSGKYWTAPGQAQVVPIDTTSGAGCMADSPRCLYAEELFFDDMRLKHVSSLSQVGPGKWFYDVANGAVYIGQEPAGHKVERSITKSAFTSASGSKVTVKNLVVEKYANASSSGALAPSEQQTV